MNKTVKKLDNNVVKALTIVCEHAKQDIVGFEWLTHSANYANFPGSLVITCVLNQSDSLNLMLVSEQDKELRKQIQKHLCKLHSIHYGILKFFYRNFLTKTQ